MDQSNGYEAVAAKFMASRGQDVQGTGTSSVRRWARSLPQGAAVLDLGCGTGIPVSQVLTEEGMRVYGIDASATLIRAFRQNFPTAPHACEAVEDSLFFHRTFDAIIAWGLLFLLSEEAQTQVIHKAAEALRSGGRLLFTAPYQQTAWKDIMTGQASRSLGAERYQELLLKSGLSLAEEFEDEGKNYYYSAVKV